MSPAAPLFNLLHALPGLSAFAHRAADAASTAAPGPQNAPERSVVVDLLLVLACAGAAAMILRRARLATIPAYLICGAIIGPSALGLIQSSGNVEAISGLAMTLLMFTIGLHLDPSSMRGGMIQMLTVGAISTLVVTLVSWPFGLAAGLSPPAALAVAMGVSMSSTAVVLSILQSSREMHRLHGRFCVGISITQDLLSLVFLALMPVLAQWSRSGKPATPAAGDDAGHAHAGGAYILDLLPAGTPMLVRALVAVLGIALLISLARLVLPRLLREASEGKSSEVPLVVTGAAALGAAALAAGLGFSPELGAFLAGFILSGTQFRAQLAGQLSPMRDLFMAVFFTAVGLKLALGSLMSVPAMLTVLLGLASVIAVKAVVIAATTWALGATGPVSVLVGLTLAQAGEFTIVLVTPALNLGILPRDDFAIVIAIVILSLIATPYLYALGRRLGPAASRIPLAGWSKPIREPHETHALAHDPAGAPPLDGAPLARYVIIAGFGVVGRAIADRFKVAHVPICVVDLNRQTVDTQRRLGHRAVYGDISNPEVLEAAGVEQADAVILTIPDDEATMRACEAIRRLRPDVFIAARTSFLAKAMMAATLGADQVIVEEVATAETMARQVLDEIRRRARPPQSPAAPADGSHVPAVNP